jgi:GNAT superfamily N-acetyltransferase
MKTEKLSGTDTLRRLDELTELVADVVGHGASLGFGLPLVRSDVQAYWRMVAGEVASGEKELFVALDERGRVQGSAQLALESRTGGEHCADVQKVMVRHARRGRGIGAVLMLRLEDAAWLAGRTVLFLDAGRGASGATDFCRRLGYTFAGSIPASEGNLGGRLAASVLFFKSLPATRPAADSAVETAPKVLAG